MFYCILNLQVSHPIKNEQHTYRLTYASNKANDLYIATTLRNYYVRLPYLHLIFYLITSFQDIYNIWFPRYIFGLGIVFTIRDNLISTVVVECE